MTRRRSTSRRTPLLFAVLTLSVLVLACGRSTSFNVTLKEPNVFQIIQTALDIAQVDLPLEISGVDIMDGSIRVGGSYTGEDGTTTSGVVDMALSTQDGEIKAEIISADITGVDLTAEQIAGFNDILSREFNKAASSVPGVKIESVTVVEDAVKLRVKVGLPEQEAP